nr:hypothetical protein [Tanacetum cinerariifolium]
KVPAVDPIIPSFRAEIIEKAPVLQVQHQVTNRFETPAVESVGDLANILEMTLSSTLKASGNSLICHCGPLVVVVIVVVIVVGVSNSVSTISDYMDSPLVVGAFGTVEVAFRAKRFGSFVWFLFSRPYSIGPCNIVVLFEWLLVLLVP